MTGNSWACSRCRKLNPPDLLTCDCTPRECAHFWELCFESNGIHCRLCGEKAKLSVDKTPAMQIKLGG